MSGLLRLLKKWSCLMKLKFISIKDARFHLNGDSYPSIIATIHSHQFVRKLFFNSKLICFSPDSIFSTAKKSCLSCKRFGCRNWLRLFLIIDDQNYCLDLPQKLMSVYYHFIDSNKINTTTSPINVEATFSLKCDCHKWILSIERIF